jgi:hypothetical protein
MSTLAERIVAATVEGMGRHGHTPSAQAIDSYRATADFIQAMADGTAEPVLAVAGGPTGSGKTEEVCAAVRELLRDPAYNEVGVLVLVSTLRQIVPLIERIGLEPEQYVVKVGTDPENDELNNMGRTALGLEDDPHHYARVMFTTQAKLKHLTKEYGRSYRDNAFFNFCGKPRQVVLWDEAFLPIDPIVVTLDDVRQFAMKLSAAGQRAAAQSLQQWVEKIDDSETAWDDVPCWPLQCMWTDFGELKAKLSEAAFDKHSDHEEQVAEAMFVLASKTVRIERQDYNKTSKVAAISWRQTVPHDIEPLLIFDADADQKMQYRLQQRWRGKVLFLPRVEKTYRNLTVRHLDRASGHIVYRRRAEVEALADIAAEAAMEYNSEKVLIIHRLGNKAPSATLKPLIKSKVRELGGDPEQLLRFVTWGHHKATNDFQDIKHLIIVGVHQVPKSNIIGLVHGAQRLPMTEIASPSAVEEMRMSEMRSDLLQAIGRGASRNMTPECDVPPGCTVDLIASSRGPMGFSNAKAVLREMFPSATVVEWERPAETSAKDLHPTATEGALELLGLESTIVVTRAHLAKAAGCSPRTIQKWLNAGTLAKALSAKGMSLHAVGTGPGGGYRLARELVHSSYNGDIGEVHEFGSPRQPIEVPS